MTRSQNERGLRERPILFSAPMVRAILDGQKTQTRRVVKSNLPRRPVTHIYGPNSIGQWWAEPGGWLFCPYGNPGERLWVRETWWIYDDAAYRDREIDGLMYRADLSPDDLIEERAARRYAKTVPGDRWRSPRFMPRWASRITLEVTSVRVERLVDISEHDALAEGVPALRTGEWSAEQTLTTGERAYDSPHRAKFAELWDGINADHGYSWKSNPWVWVVEFTNLGAASSASACRPSAEATQTGDEKREAS